MAVLSKIRIAPAGEKQRIVYRRIYDVQVVGTPNRFQEQDA